MAASRRGGRMRSTRSVWLHWRMQNVDLVKSFLRAQNLEQLGRTDEAIELYEEVVGHRFDATGPYDRLISIYSNQARHQEVERIAVAALANVHTHEQKRGWYQEMREAAVEAARQVPAAAPKRRA
ncbi:MAG: hypothetical protein KY391_05835 [Actinobacteria bacterium]|nr:hypothetical protein [Actinomycetota bacterium]